jgi:hypothetical protein
MRVGFTFACSVLLCTLFPAGSATGAALPGVPSGVVAVIGGSLSRQAAVGAWREDRQAWFVSDYPINMGGGTVLKWADPADPRWAAFDDFRVRYPTSDVVWWQILFHEDEFETKTPHELYDKAEITYANAALHTVGQRIYVSPMFRYLPGSQCRTSDAAVALSIRIVARLLAAHPDLHAGPLFEDVPPELMEPTGCHLNDAGDRDQGDQLLAFFAAV